MHVPNVPVKGVVMGVRLIVATDEIRELLGYTVLVGGQRKLAGRLSIGRPQLSKWDTAIEEEREIRVRASTFEAVERVLAELRGAEADMQFRQGVRFAVEKLVPALEGLQPYAPDLLPISPAVGEKAGIFVGTVDRQVEKEAAKRQPAEKRKRDV